MKVEIRGRITIPASQITPGSFQPGAYTIPGSLQVTGNLQLGNAYAAGAIVATGTVDILDATGTVYHVLVHN